MEVFNAIKKGSKNLVSVMAYKGDAMTFLCFDIDPSLTADFVGFTIQVKQDDRKEYFLSNRMSFSDAILKASNIDAKEKLSSAYSPFQKFRWVHVPSSQHFVDAPYFGKYTYTVTPRYLKNGKLVPLDAKLSVSVTIAVSPFKSGDLQIGFARGFISSEAYTAHFGNNGYVRPKGNKDLIFDIKQKSGTANRWDDKKKSMQPADYTFEEQHTYLGWQARARIMEFLDEVNKNKSINLDVFAFDLDEPVISKQLLDFSAQGRCRVLLDNSPSHAKKGCSEEQFAAQVKDKKSIFRGHYSSLAHTKVLIQRDKKTGKAIKVLTGSTNFSTNGLYVNANHILIFNNAAVAQWYADAFDASFGDKEMGSFKKGKIASQEFQIQQKNLPAGIIRFSPHPKDFATKFFDLINKRILSAQSDILFAIMQDGSGSSILDAVKKQVKSDKLFTYGITDKISKDATYNVSLYKPDSTRGIRVAGAGTQNVLPPPFGTVAKIPGISVHHKFVVVDFKGDNPVVYCGSSNLAFGPEQANGDNLIEIRDKDAVTAFAIEAIRLVDHFHWRNKQTAATKASKPLTLNDNSTKKWFAAYYDPKDLMYLERTLFMKQAK
jgi:phosphatidylserine/phosphatidylglycerophosphate/cardiolipin synthase-like enzyme